MDIRGYLPTSVNEWPGKVAAIVWVAGCNFRCPFCQNRDLVLFPQKLVKVSEKGILEDLKKRKGWVDAVVVTGGEPTLQTDLPLFLAKVKKIGFLTMIETNGSQSKVLARLFKEKLLDRISMDIKGSFGEYEKMTGVKIHNSLPRRQAGKFIIYNSIKLILSYGVDFEFRTTVVPTLHNKENMILLAKQLRKLTINHQPSTINWFLQQFVPQNCLDPEFGKIKSYRKKEMKAILAGVKKYFPSVKLRGI